MKPIRSESTSGEMSCPSHVGSCTAQPNVLSTGCSAERGAGAAQVVGGDHQANAAESGVGQVDVDMGRSESASELSQAARPVHDVDHEDLALVRDPHPRGVKCPTKSR